MYYVQYFGIISSFRAPPYTIQVEATLPAAQKYSVLFTSHLLFAAEHHPYDLSRQVVGNLVPLVISPPSFSFSRLTLEEAKKVRQDLSLGFGGGWHCGGQKSFPRHLKVEDRSKWEQRWKEIPAQIAFPITSFLYNQQSWYMYDALNRSLSVHTSFSKMRE